MKTPYMDITDPVGNASNITMHLVALNQRQCIDESCCLNQVGASKTTYRSLLALLDTFSTN